MPVLTANRECHRSTLGGAIISISLLFSAGAVYAQQVPFGLMVQPAQVELTAPHVEVISGAAAARLEQAKQLAAARSWDEAIDIWSELIGDKSNRVVAIGANRYVSLRSYCHLQIARLPSEGLAAYRRRLDAPAEQLYRDGVAKHDERLLRCVIDESFCSSWGDDALLALGDIALERGDYSSARGYWEQISPLLSAPDGSTTWSALRNIDLNAKWPEVEKRWQDRKTPADWLAYPDTQLDLAEIRARLVLVSIRAGDLDRAAQELEAFKRSHPDAVGQFGGQKEKLAPALERLLTAAREWPPLPKVSDWPTFAGSHTRSRIATAARPELVPIWKEPIALTPPKYVRLVRLVQGGVGGEGSAKPDPDAVVRESQRPLSCYPIVAGDVVLFADGVGIHAAELATGRPTITPSGLLNRSETTDARGDQAMLSAVGGVAHGVPRLTLEAIDSILYARVGSLPTSRPQPAQGTPGDRIIGLDLRREGLLTFQTPHQEDAWTFDGAPVSDGRRVLVAMRRSDVTPHAYVACFDAATGMQQWRTPIGSADTIAGGADELTHNLLTFVENRVYINTNLGLVAALDASSGDVVWISRYDRLASKAFVVGAATPLCFDRDPSPCVYDGGLLFVVPSDSPTIFAIDANTGKVIWKQEQLPDALHLLGVVEKHLIVSGERVAALDILSGHIDWVWPESNHAGVRGMGRGVLAGREIFWPTRNEILAIDPKTGSQTRPPISLSPIAGGANLAASRGRLIVVGFDKLMVLGPPGKDTRASIDVPRTGQLGDHASGKRNY